MDLRALALALALTHEPDPRLPPRAPADVDLAGLRHVHGHQLREGQGVGLGGETDEGDEHGGAVPRRAGRLGAPRQARQAGNRHEFTRGSALDALAHRPARHPHRSPGKRTRDSMDAHLHRALGQHHAGDPDPVADRVPGGRPAVAHPQRHDVRTAGIAAHDDAVVVRRRRRRDRRVGEARVVRVVADVLAAVVVEADQSVGTGGLHEPVGRGDRGDRVRALGRRGFLDGRPHLVLGGQQQTEERLARPVRGRGAGVVLQDGLVGAVPAEGQQTVGVHRAPLKEVLQRTGRQPSRLPRGEWRTACQGAQPQGCRGRETVGEGAALKHGCAVAAEQAGVVLQMPRESAAVPLQQPLVPRRPGVQHRVEVHGPAVVVVELPAVAVRVPAAADVPVLDALQSPVDRLAGLLALVPDLLEEAAHRHREQLPVVGPGFGGQPVGQPGSRPLTHRVVEPVPQQRPGQPQGERDRRGLDQRLAVVLDAGPDARGARREAVGVALQRRLVPAEGGEQQRAGVALQTVAEAARAALVAAGEVVEGPVLGGVRLHGTEQGVGSRLPVGAGAAGAGAQGGVLGRQLHRFPFSPARRTRGRWSVPAVQVYVMTASAQYPSRLPSTS